MVTVSVCGLFQPTSCSQSTTEGTWTGSYVDSVAPSSQYSHVYFQVCREFQRGTCSRQDSDCRYAHPPDNVTIESPDNHVTVCMDSVKGQCSRETCRYFHPPPHLQLQCKAAQQRAAASTTSCAAAAAATAAAPVQVSPLVGYSTACLISHSLAILASTAAPGTTELS